MYSKYNKCRSLLSKSDGCSLKCNSDLTFFLFIEEHYKTRNIQWSMVTKDAIYNKTYCFWIGPRDWDVNLLV